MIVDHVDAARERERERNPNYKMSLLDIAGDMVYLRPTVQFPKGKHLELSQDLLRPERKWKYDLVNLLTHAIIDK